MLAATMRSVPRLLSTIVIVAAIGFLWAHFGLPHNKTAPPPLARQGAVGSFKVDYPATWTLTPARPVARFPLSDEIQLTSTLAGSATLVIGTAHPPNPYLLPQRLRAVLSPQPQPQTIRLGGLDFLRFTNLTPAGLNVTESVYVLPTTFGTITGVCSATTPSVTFTSGCERVLASIQVTSGSPLSLGVDTGYALALNQILTELNTARAADGPGLRATDLTTRAHAATALALAHATAATSAGAISASGMSAANPALVSALTLDSTAYRNLARAASHQDQGAYTRAVNSLQRASQALNRVYDELRVIGYRVG